MAKSLTINNDRAGQRVDIVAGELLPTLSRAYIRRLIDSGRVTLNNENAKAGSRVHIGDKLKTDFEERELEKIASIELPILYEDENVIVINKPVGVISHSRGKYWNEPSVASFVRQKTGQPGERAGIVHRLDRATSGVMVCAKNTTSLSWLQKQFSQRQVTKTYLAVVQGTPKVGEAVIDVPIERNPKAPATFRAGSNGKTAQTHYKVLQTNDEYSLIELQPFTGRTHQLRVHLKHIGHPIVGDNLYGGQEYPRLLLHAKTLSIKLPTNEQKVFEAPLPDEFSKIMTAV